jgi:tRNA pseudouridine55 synthase
VSKGTYIRTLAEDIGAALGCGAHLSALRRTATGAYTVDQCVRLEALEALDEAARLALLAPPESLLAGHRVVTLGAEDAGRFLSGMRRRGSWPNAGAAAVFGPATLPAGDAAATPSSAHPAPIATSVHSARPRTDSVLLGTAHIQSGELIPGRLLSPIEIQQILSS